MSIDENDDEFSGPSRSQNRRDALAILKLAETLATLSDAQLARLPLADNVLDEIRRTRATTQQIARKRQTQFLAKQMRKIDDEGIAAIRLVLDSDRHQSNRETAALHQVEALRDRLIADGDTVLTEVIESYPDADRQHLRTLIRQARLEAEKQKPPRASRELFRILRDLHTKAAQ